MALQHFQGPEQREALYRGKAFGGLSPWSGMGAKKVEAPNPGP